MRPVTSSRCLVAVLALAAAACGGDRWPDPPAVDSAAYQQEYAEWQQRERQRIAEALPIIGIWLLAEGDTPFGTDKSLPVALPESAGARQGGVLRRTGDTITVIPASGVTLRHADGNPVTGPAELDDPLTLGAIELSPTGSADGRLFVTARDLNHPAATTLPPAETFALDPKWRVAARFEAFPTPRRMKIGDVLGVETEETVYGELVFRLDGREHRLIALDGPDEFFVMFKDKTNGDATYGGYRILTPKKVAAGEFTVLDFNLAFNPPCAYSSFTNCPLPPRENTLDVTVEAGQRKSI